MRLDALGKADFIPEPDKTASSGPRRHTSALNKEIGGVVPLILGGKEMKG
jgi:hypothetical protein